MHPAQLHVSIAVIDEDTGVDGVRGDGYHTRGGCPVDRTCRGFANVVGAHESPALLTHETGTLTST